MLETNVDDLDPRLWPGVLAALLDAGAADAWLTPVLMKKGRPAHTLHVLCDDAVLHDVRHVVVTHTSAIGFREHRVVKHALERRMTSVEVRGQPVRVKVSSYDGAIVTAQPEFDDVAAVAAALGLPPRVLLAEAVVAAEMVRTAGDLDVPVTAADTGAAPHTDAATDVATGADR